jgi:hypothetical protein
MNFCSIAKRWVYPVMFAVALGACGSDDEESTPAARCGDGKINGTEECDKTAFGGETCTTQTNGARPTGNLTCTAQCTISDTGCTGGGTGGTGGGGTGGSGGLAGGAGTGGDAGGGTGGTAGGGTAGADAG